MAAPVNNVYSLFMSNTTQKMIKLVGISNESYEKAVQNAIDDAHQTVKGLNWFEVIEQRGKIDETGKVAEWQVIVEVAFKILK